MPSEARARLEALALRAQAGDERALEQALRLLRPLIYKTASRYHLPDGDNELLVAEATYWAWRALLMWQPGHGVGLVLWVRRILWRRLLDMVRVATRQHCWTGRPPLSLDAPWMFRCSPDKDTDASKTLLSHGERGAPVSPSAEEVVLGRWEAGRQRELVAGLRAMMTPLQWRVVVGRVEALHPKYGVVCSSRVLRRWGITPKQADNALRGNIRPKLRRWAEERVAQPDPPWLARRIVGK